MIGIPPPATRELPTPDRPPVQLKGRGRGLRLSIAPRCDPAEAEASLRSQLAGRGGGFLLSDNHGEIPQLVPDEVLLAIGDAVDRWGRYPLDWIADWQDERA